MLTLKSSSGYGDEFSRYPFKDALLKVLPTAQNLQLFGTGSGYRAEFIIDNKKVKAEFFTNGALKKLEEN